ncbi:MAG: hypothetical protein H6557_08400 [Lewinellaceae bacterium]|nr:hypothetical protein [Phaeodactylibacter sp.]MCB9036623.1 hypothetical protein [Lewinellaceae bacterium]
MSRKILFLLPALLSLPLITQAHDGHGFFHGNEFAHYLSSPGHAIPLMLVVAAAVALAVYWRRSRAEDNV